MALRSGTGVRCARMSSATLPVALTAARAASSSTTLRPMPTTTCTGPPDSARISMRMPPSLPSRGHEVVRPLERTPGTPSAASASTAHKPDDQRQRREIGGHVGVLPGRATGRWRLRAARPSRGRAGRGRRSGARRAPRRRVPGGRRQRLQQPRVGGFERPLDEQRFDARAHLGGQQRLDALRRQRADARREPITLVGLRVERDAELAQLLHRLPHRGARDRQIRGQRFARDGTRGRRDAGTRAAAAAWRWRRSRAAAPEQPQPAGARLGAGAHAPHVAAMGIDDEHARRPARTPAAASAARRHAAVDRPAWRSAAMIDARPTKPDTMTTASQLANSGSSSTSSMPA